MKRVLSILFLLLISSVACADTTGALSQAKDFGFSLTPPSTDESVAYLSMIFGTVGNVLHGSGGQILGEMFGIFNKGVMVVAALWLAMTTVQVVLRSAAEGSFLGQNRTVHLVFLRVALGFALIIPSASTGYSLLQDFYMKIVLSSVALADDTWNTALNYLKYGGQLYIPPQTLNAEPVDKVTKKFFFSGNQISTSNYAVGTTKLGVAAQIFQDEVCMIRSGSRAWNQGKTLQSSYNLQFDPANGKVVFPGINGGGDTEANDNCGSVLSYCAANSSNCGLSSLTGYDGSVEMSSETPGSDLANSNNTSTQNVMKWNYAWLAVKQLAISLLPAAQNYVDQYGAYDTANPGANVYPTDGSDPAQDMNAKTFFNAIVGYGNLMVPVQNMANTSSSSALQSDIPSAESGGWITAGSLYWQIEQLNQGASALNALKLVPSVNMPDVSALQLGQGSSADPGTELLAAAVESVGGSAVGGITFTGYAKIFDTDWAAFTGAANNESAAQEEANQTGGANQARDAAFTIFGSLDTNQMPSSSEYNPIAFIMKEGQMVLGAVASLWAGALLASVILAIPAGICNSTLPGGLILKTLMTWIKAIAMLISTALIIPGMVFAYYVPLYPFAVFTFAVIGWFMLVAEGLAAAPLICVGMTHPEGHDFLGKGEQALMFYLSIFIRPTLLIIGLIASMLVSFIAFQILLAGYGHLMSALPKVSTANLGALFIVIINSAASLCIFAYFSIEIIEQSYKLIFQLPQYVMRWIGGPETGHDYGQLASQLKGATQGVGGGLRGIGKAGGGAIAGSGELAKEYKEGQTSKVDIDTNP